MGSCPRLMHCGAVYSRHEGVIYRSQFVNSITNSIWTQQEALHYCLMCDWSCLPPVTANENQTKFQRWNCPHLCTILHYPRHFNSLLNYFQIHTDSWFILSRTLQRNWSNSTYLKGHSSNTLKTPEGWCKWYIWTAERKKRTQVVNGSTSLNTGTHSQESVRADWAEALWPQGEHQTVIQHPQSVRRPSEHHRWCTQWLWQRSGNLYYWLAHLLNTLYKTTSVPSLTPQHLD